ncbi:unnamed protein product [Rhizophagus irregularis]|nr:unnamed protein product [Rhizophagus irregularis]
MSVIRKDLIYTTLNKAYALTDYNIHNDIHKHTEFQKQTILADESLTKDEKSEAIRILTVTYDRSKLIYNEGTRRMKTLEPNVIVEWIPYNNLKNIKYLTKGGYSEIYTAEWVDGGYDGWDSNEQQLKRLENCGVVLKRLENVESANKRWLKRFANSHLNICNKWSDAIVQCYGLTKDPLNGDYMLVMNQLNTDLRKYLQQNHNQLTWKERIQIATDIILALSRVHDENAIHRDLHSGNILFRFGENFIISDLGFCGPADKPLKSVYGNLPYIAPEVIAGKVTTFKSDIYSIGILMWEISSGQPPFINYEHNYDLAMYIINGIRPKIVSGTPLEYKNLMKQCWDADPSKRPDIVTLDNKIKDNSLEISGLENYTNSSRLFTSKVHQFENLPEPRNATEEEQEEFYSNKSYNFYIPNNIDDFDKLNNQKNISTEESLKGNSKNVIQETMQQQIKKYHDDIDDDEIHNNPNLHTEEQDELELPDNIDN